MTPGQTSPRHPRCGRALGLAKTLRVINGTAMSLPPGVPRDSAGVFATVTAQRRRASYGGV